MATPRATPAQHRTFWAGGQADDQKEQYIGIVAQMAADVRVSVSPEPGGENAGYDSAATSAELAVAQFISRAGVSSTSANGVSVSFSRYEEAEKLAAGIMRGASSGSVSGGARNVLTENDSWAWRDEWTSP